MACSSWLMNLDFAGSIGGGGAPSITNDNKHAGWLGRNIGRVGRLGAILVPTVLSIGYSIPIG